MYRFNSFTQKANEVLNLAIKAAEAYGHNYVGSEHILIGLLKEGTGLAASALGEKDITLELALKLKEYLTSKDVLVVMTRESDCEIYDDNASTLREKKVSDIHNRMKLMNETENCIFISIHQNTFSEGKYSGTQVFYAPHTEYGSELAQSIQNSVVSEIQPDNKRQIKPCTQSVYLIYNAKKTAVLVE